MFRRAPDASGALRFFPALFFGDEQAHPPCAEARSEGRSVERLTTLTRNGLALFVAAVMLASCAGTPAQDDLPTASTAGMPGALEPVRAAAFTQDQAVFWVTSNGCTEKEDLLPIVSLQGGKAVITLRRIDEDTCRRPQDEGVELKWSFDELGLPAGSPVVVNNPYQLPSGG